MQIAIHATRDRRRHGPGFLVPALSRGMQAARPVSAPHSSRPAKGPQLGKPCIPVLGNRHNKGWEDF